jgi:hypothetical protein
MVSSKNDNAKGKARIIEKHDSSSSEEDSDEELRKKLVEIEAVCNSMIGESGELEYEIKWKDLPEDFRTWETRQDMEDAQVAGLELVDAFDLGDRRSRRAIKEENEFIRSSSPSVSRKPRTRQIIDEEVEEKKMVPRRIIRSRKKRKIEELIEEEADSSIKSESEFSESSDDDANIVSKPNAPKIVQNNFPQPVHDEKEENDHIDLDMDGWASLLDSNESSSSTSKPAKTSVKSKLLKFLICQLTYAKTLPILLNRFLF